MKDKRFVGIEETITTDSAGDTNDLIANGWQVLHILQEPVYRDFKGLLKETTELIGYKSNFIVGRPPSVLPKLDSETVWKYVERITSVHKEETKEVK